MTKKSKKPSISIIIPAYNEEENIAYILKDSLQKLPKFFSDYEIIVVDDGSKDKTGEIADRYATKNSTIRVIHQKNGGYSKAMLSGIKAAKKEFIAYMPADGQFMVDDMRHCFEVMKDSDLILGYRGGRTDYATRRIFFSYGYLLLLLLLFDVKYMDVGWVNIWRASKLKRLKLKAVGGIFILTEILVRFRRKGLNIVEAPSYYHPRISGEVKNAKLKVVMATFFNALKLWWEIQRKK
jgi:glycosyltransferase involved in cell wall biosynthesis